MDDLPHLGGFFQDDKILQGDLPVLSKFLSFYLTSPLLACVLCVQGGILVSHFSTSLTCCLT